MAIDVVWDMETGDPDDCLTLALLCGHPAVRLKAVTIVPGSAAQVGVVRAVLDRLGVAVPVGAGNVDHPHECVSEWHVRVLGTTPPSRQAEPAADLLTRACDQETTLITGAPLQNLAEATLREGFALGRWVAQGGFAGEGVVPPAWQLEKFRGKATCPTWNFGASKRFAGPALASPSIRERRLVGKNVCHGMPYDRGLHDAVAREIRDLPDGRHRRSLELIHEWMSDYLERRGPKALHDPLAACCAIDPGIADWAEVEPLFRRGEWGSRLAPGSGTWAAIQGDRERFTETFLGRDFRQLDLVR